jgi:hypothetical protein
MRGAPQAAAADPRTLEILQSQPAHAPAGPERDGALSHVAAMDDARSL